MQRLQCIGKSHFSSQRLTSANVLPGRINRQLAIGNWQQARVSYGLHLPFANGFVAWISYWKLIYCIHSHPKRAAFASCFWAMGLNIKTLIMQQSLC
jgi:hypothetical protein